MARKRTNTPEPRMYMRGFVAQCVADHSAKGTFAMDKKLILDQFAFQRRYISVLVDDIPDKKMAVQPGGVVNHPAWQLGHLAAVHDFFTKALTGQTTLGEDWSKKFGPGSAPSSNRDDYPCKAELLGVFEERRQALACAFEQAADDTFAKPNPNARFAKILPTVGHLMQFGMLFHESTHLGQLASWRKAMGMVPASSKFEP